ncbi:MAG: tetratricopeptide repeat protein [Myxococcota bacterium]
MGWMVALGCVVAGSAAAQAPTLEPTDRGVPEEAQAEAHALFQAGRLAFEQDRYEVALDRFGEAYELTRHAELLYNMGLAADRARLDDRAIELYEQYLAEAEPDSSMRRSVESRLAGLRRARERRNAETPGDEAPDRKPVPSAADAARSTEPEPGEQEASSAPRAASEADVDEGGGTSPWVWVGIGGGALAVGAAVLTAVLLTRDGGGPAAGDHGVVVTTLGER